MTQLASRNFIIKSAPVYGSGVFLAIWLYSHIAQSVYVSLYFDGFIANGPFQLFNPLRRIANGQIAGVDFQFFHGLGVPFLHYPLFALFGKSLFASELSRNLTSLICFISSLFTFGFVVTKHNIKKAIYFTVSAICLLEFLSLEKVDSYGLALATPGNSLLGVRAIFPIFAFAALLSRSSLLLKAFVTGSLFAASLLFGTEHGLSLIVSFIIVNGLAILRALIKNRKIAILDNSGLSWKFQIAVLLAFVIALILIFGATTGFSEISQVLKYNLIEVPSDQFWFFGAPPNDYARSLADFTQLSWRGIILLIAVILWLSACVCRFFFIQPSFVTNDQITLTHMLCYGLMTCASCLGMLEKGYLLPMIRIFVLAILVQLFKEDYVRVFVSQLRNKNPLFLKPVLLIYSLLIITFFTTIIFVSVKRLPPICYLPGDQVSPQLSILWNKHFSQIDNALLFHFRENKKYKIWSTYSGLLEERHQIFHPKDDYIIHALGDRRRKSYISAFCSYQADVVQTLRRSHFIGYTQNRDYEQWLRNTTWGFYEEVLNNYQVLTATDRSILWVRKPAQWVSPDEHYEAIPIASDAHSLEIPVPKTENNLFLLVIKLQYRISNPWKSVPIIGGLPRHLVKLNNAANCLPISLSPYQQEAHFPITVKPGVNPTLFFETKSLLPGASMSVDSVSYKLVRLTEDQKVFLYD